MIIHWIIRFYELNEWMKYLHLNDKKRFACDTTLHSLILTIFKGCEQQPDICKIVSLCAISGIIIFNEEKYNRSLTKMAGHTWFEIVFYVVFVLIGVTIYRFYTYIHDIRIMFLYNNFHYNC